MNAINPTVVVKITVFRDLIQPTIDIKTQRQMIPKIKEAPPIIRVVNKSLV